MIKMSVFGEKCSFLMGNEVKKLLKEIVAIKTVISYTIKTKLSINANFV